MLKLLSIFFGAAVVNNFILARFLGLCPFFGVSKETKPALSMGIAVTFVMVLGTVITYPLYYFILSPLDLTFLKIVSFILVIASLVQFIELYMKKYQKRMFDAFGIYLPLITTNCAILGAALLYVLKEYSFIESTVFAIGAGSGFTLALLLMSGIREKLDEKKVPAALRGVPLALIIAGILALAFAGFSGVIQ